MARLNIAILVGRLTRDPEVRYSQSGTAVGKIRLAVNSYRGGQDRQNQEETLFINVIAFGNLAQVCERYLSRGREVLVEGRLRLNEWTTPEGQRRSTIEVVARNIQFLGSAPSGDRDPFPRDNRGYDDRPAPAAPPPSDMDSFPDIEDDVPF